MANWYTTREAIKAIADISGTAKDSIVDDAIESASREIDKITNRRFIPKTAIRYFDWPISIGPSPYILMLDEDLLSVSALTKEGDDVTAIVNTDYFLRPSNFTPYQWIEIDLASTAFFSAKNTHQRQIRVTGSWGWSEDTKAAGALAEADDGSETELQVTDASLIGVGDTLLIGTEQMFVSAKGLFDTTANTNGVLTASQAETSVTVNTGTLVKAGEVISINSERMLVESISGNVLAVIRAYDGSTLAAHLDAQDVYAYRSLTVTRGANGTTAAAHDSATAISKYAPPGDIVQLCQALALAYIFAGRGGWTGVVGTGDGAVETTLKGLSHMREEVKKHYRRNVVVAV